MEDRSQRGRASSALFDWKTSRLMFSISHHTVKLVCPLMSWNESAFKVWRSGNARCGWVMNKGSSSEKCKMWSRIWSLCSQFIGLRPLFQMRRSTSIVAARRRMKKETWENRGQCPHKRAHTLRLHFWNTLNCLKTNHATPVAVPLLAPSSTTPASRPWGGTSCASRWPTRSARKRSGDSSWSSSRTRSTSACCWLSDRNASRSKRSRGGG